MPITALESNYSDRLESLAAAKKITEGQFRHFRDRGIQVFSFQSEYEELGKFFPEIAVYASKSYVEKMKVPYQATSFLGASALPDGKGPYVFKIPGQKGGGVEKLTGGKRRDGDNVFASLHRILIGYRANMVSADNFMDNRSQLWNYEFFAQHLSEKLRGELAQLAKRQNIMKYPYHVVVARSEDTFRRLGILEQRGSITALSPENGAEVIFLTNGSGYDYASREIPEWENKVHYIETGKDFDMLGALTKLRKNYNIDVMLNDGGRQMSNGVRGLGLLGEERITKEPYPGVGVVPENLTGSVIDVDGAGLDGRGLQGAVKIYSRKINDEVASIYLCQLDEDKIF